MNGKQRVPITMGPSSLDPHPIRGLLIHRIPVLYVLNLSSLLINVSNLINYHPVGFFAHLGGNAPAVRSIRLQLAGLLLIVNN